MDLEELRQRAQLHPLVEGVKGDIGADAELCAEGQGRVGPVDGRFMRETASQKHCVLSRHWGPHRGVRTSAAQRVRQLRGALAEPAAEHGRVLVEVAGVTPSAVRTQGCGGHGDLTEADAGVVGRYPGVGEHAETGLLQARHGALE